MGALTDGFIALRIANQGGELIFELPVFLLQVTDLPISKRNHPGFIAGRRLEGGKKLAVLGKKLLVGSQKTGDILGGKIVLCHGPSQITERIVDGSRL